MRSAGLILLAAGALLLATGLPSPAGQDRAAVDTVQLDVTETLSESLTNDLLLLSVAVRDKDRATIERFFAETMTATPIPYAPVDRPGELDWIGRHEWPTLSPGRMERGEFLAGLERLVEHFPTIEDVRFKVKSSTFEGDAEVEGSARIWLFVVGRDQEGRREWLTAWAGIVARRIGEQDWRIERLELETVDSLIAEREIFSEVALPAGLRQEFPPFGTEPNDTVVAHGAAAADVDGDGLLDLATTGVVENRLYLNEGDGTFRDASDETFVSLAPAASAPLFVDFDNDSDVDLFLSTVGTQILLENRLVPDGELRFLDRSLAAGVAVPANGFGAAAADVNDDGWPDIYVASYNRYGLVMPNSWDRATNGTPNLLFLNRGDGTFEEAGEQWQVRDSRWSYAAAFADIDEDGDQDLYVANDFGENGLYLNEGGRFRAAAGERGVVDPGNGMGVAFGDYDNDGDLDLHVTNMSSTAGNRILSRLSGDLGPDDSVLRKLAAGNSLYANDGTGSFDYVTPQVGGLAAGWAFGGGFIDFNNDGWEDLYAPNGFISGKLMEDT